MKAYISYEGLQRVERYQFPAPALREALLNAVVHKDYSSGNPVQISVYEDKIIFWNAGRLPDGLSLELLQKKHPSIPYNPLVASAFFRAGYIEAWGLGIEKINNECKLAGVPAPEINSDCVGLMITFQSDIAGKTTVETTVETPDAIIRLMAEKPDITLAEIAAHIEKSVRTVERAAAKLKKEGKITFKGPKKGGRWEILV